MDESNDVRWVSKKTYLDEDLLELYEKHLGDEDATNENEESKGVKRTLSTESDEWTPVRGRRRLSLPKDDGDQHSVSKLDDCAEVTVSSKEPLPKQIGMARLLKSENIPNIIRVKYINPYKAVIQIDNECSLNMLLESKRLSELGWRLQKTSEIGVCYGIIRDIEKDATEEHILENLISEEMPIVNVKRLKRRMYDSSEWENSEAVRVGFKGPKLPEYVYIHESRLKVDKFVFPVTQCSRCWRFGHMYKMCSLNKTVCPKCSGHHANCDTSKFRCANCSGKHMALAKTCPVYKKEKRIREMMAETHCTYRQALKIIVSPPTTTTLRTQAVLHGSDFPNALNISEPYHDMPEPIPAYSNATRAQTEVLVTETSQPSIAANTKIDRRRKKHTKLSKSRKSGKDNFMEDDLESSSDNDINYKEGEGMNKDKDDNNWIELLRTLKNIIFSKRYPTCSEKVIASIKSCWNWFVKFVVEKISEWPILSSIFCNNNK